MYISFFLFLTDLRVRVNKTVLFLKLFALFYGGIVVFSAPLMADKPLRLLSMDEDFTLTLSDDSTVKLAGIVPLRTAPRLPEDWQNQAVTVTEIARNRYGDSLVLLRRDSDNALLQSWLVENEHAMVYGHHDGALAALTSLEIPEKAHIDHSKAEKYIDSWAAVSGTIHSVTLRKQAAYLNFSEDWKKDFTIYLPKSSLSFYSPSALQALSGKHVRVRGWVHAYYGPRITLFHPDMLEILEVENEPR